MVLYKVNDKFSHLFFQKMTFPLTVLSLYIFVLTFVVSRLPLSNYFDW